MSPQQRGVHVAVVLKCSLCTSAGFELFSERNGKKKWTTPDAVTVIAGWAVCDPCRYWLMGFHHLLTEGGRQAASIIGQRIVDINRGGRE
jgi:hypothetical protein